MFTEFDRLLQKHATETGLPVIVDFYSDSCGPCRQMAPIYKKVAAEMLDKAVFVKIDTAQQSELSSRYQIRSLPTFAYFLNNKKVNQVTGGIGEQALRQQAGEVVRQAEAENVVLKLEVLMEYYQNVDVSKEAEAVAVVYQKCADMNKKKSDKQCVGSAANQLARKLKKKYGSKPKLEKRFQGEAADADGSSSKPGKKAPTSTPTTNDDAEKKRKQPKEKAGKEKQPKQGKANLQFASKQELEAELERRLDQERDEQVESEDPDEDEPDPDFHRWTAGPFPERLVIIGGGPAGMAAAIYAARAGLSPLVVAPTMGGQLQGKGVDVENYPGLHNMTGPAVVAAMRAQAAHFGAIFEDDVVESVQIVEASANGGRLLRVVTNLTGAIDTHSIIMATGAESNWLDVPGEWELRGGGVSSCATCDGALYAGKHVVVVGGGDTAMEDALVLARTSKAVTVVHRRDRFRASKVLGDRVLNHPLINVVWNSSLQEIVGRELPPPEEDNVDLDTVQPKVVSGVVLADVSTGDIRRMDCDAVFVAIGHTPTTSFLQGVVDFNPDHAGYIQVLGGTTHTSVPGIFAAGDVTDAVYRQAVTSAGSGAAAALDAERYLSEHGLGNEAAELEAELLAEMMQDEPTIDAASYYNAYDDAGGRMQGMKESISAGEL
jgi:thioredoxin reductase (NADPH)